MLVAILAQTTCAADRMPSEAITFAAQKLGDKIAVLIPDGMDFIKRLCEIVGDAGHVYAISIPENSVVNCRTTRVTTGRGGRDFRYPLILCSKK